MSGVCGVFFSESQTYPSELYPETLETVELISLRHPLFKTFAFLLHLSKKNLIDILLHLLAITFEVTIQKSIQNTPTTKTYTGVKVGSANFCINHLGARKKHRPPYNCCMFLSALPRTFPRVFLWRLAFQTALRRLGRTSNPSATILTPKNSAIP